MSSQKLRGFKRGPGRTGHSLSAAGIRVHGAKDQGWPLRGSGIFTNVPEGWAEGEEQEESQESSSSSSNFPGGQRGFCNPRRDEHGRARTAKVNAIKKGREVFNKEERAIFFSESKVESRVTGILKKKSKSRLKSRDSKSRRLTFAVPGYQ